MMTASMSLYSEADKLPGDHDDGFGACDHDWKLVRRTEPTTPKGRASALWVRRLPAAFFRLTSGDVAISTGSGREAANLVERVARALAGGQVSLRATDSGITFVASVSGARRLVEDFDRATSSGMVGVEGTDR
jgi:hypothetical protein